MPVYFLQRIIRRILYEKSVCRVYQVRRVQCVCVCVRDPSTKGVRGERVKRIIEKYNCSIKLSKYLRNNNKKSVQRLRVSQFYRT